MEFSSIKAVQMQRLGVEGNYLGEFGERRLIFLVDRLVKSQRSLRSAAHCKELAEPVVKKLWLEIADSLASDYISIRRSWNQDVGTKALFNTFFG
jgi:hypothetical protein